MVVVVVMMIIVVMMMIMMEMMTIVVEAMEAAAYLRFKQLAAPLHPRALHRALDQAVGGHRRAPTTRRRHTLRSRAAALFFADALVSRVGYSRALLEVALAIYKS